MFSLRNKILTLVFVSGFLVTSCASGVLGPSESEIEAEAAREFGKMRAELPLVTDRATIDYVHCVVTAVVDSLESPHSDQNWELAIFDVKQVNAFAMPGGKVGVFSGLLDIATNQDQLATVVGHELAHVTARHVNERASRGGFTDAGIYVAAIVLGQGHSGLTHTAYEGLRYGASLGLILPYERKQESEADVIGLEYMARAGFDPRESVELWKKMSEEKGDEKPPEFLSTHPADEKRIDALVAMYPNTLVLFNEAKSQGKEPTCGRQ
ncbi:MAG: M48 family metallopeptidase [Woeseia sp.]